MATNRITKKVENMSESEKTRLNALAIKVLGLRIIKNGINVRNGCRDRYGIGDATMIAGATVALAYMEEKIEKMKATPSKKPRKKK